MNLLNFSLYLSIAFLFNFSCWAMEGEIVYELYGTKQYTREPNNKNIGRPTRPQEKTESVLKQVIEGEDGRMPVENTEEWPYSIHGQVSMQYSNGEYTGSGTLVGPHHFLTAGHNVYDHKKKEWAKSIFVSLGLKKEETPFGTIRVTKIITFSQWIKKQNKCYDVALLLLNQPVGNKSGWDGGRFSRQSATRPLRGWHLFARIGQARFPSRPADVRRRHLP